MRVSKIVFVVSLLFLNGCSECENSNWAKDKDGNPIYTCPDNLTKAHLETVVHGKVIKL